MPAPSSHDESVEQFVDERWGEIAESLNGDSVTKREEILTKGMLRAMGWLREDVYARMDVELESSWKRVLRGRLEPQEILLLGGIFAVILERVFSASWF